MSAIVVEGAGRMYALYAHPTDRLKELLRRRPYHRNFWALQDASFTVPKGQTLGIVGANGSGKSTLLQLLAGVLQPTIGRVEVRGRVAALLELGAGFNPEFSGRENVVLNGAILGVTETEIRARLPAIAEFAGIGDFLDQPVKTYSSGMYVRLAFATAINIDPEVLLVDEALAVGDAYFQHRCMLRLAELQAQGVTIVLVSHDAAAIKRLCERVLWIDGGHLVADGDPEAVVGRYLASLFGQAEQPTSRDEPPPIVDDTLAPPNVDRRFGNGDAEIVGIGVFDRDGRPTESVVHGHPFELRVRVWFRRPVARPVVGFVLRDRLGTELASTNTALEGEVLPAAAAGSSFTVCFTCTPPRLHPGHYAFVATVANGSAEEYEMNDWIDTAFSLELTGEVPIHTMMRFPVRCTLAHDGPRAEAEDTRATSGKEHHHLRGGSFR